MEDKREKVEVVLSSEERIFYDRLFEEYKENDVRSFELMMIDRDKWKY